MVRKKSLTKAERRVLARRKLVVRRKRPYHKKILLHPVNVFFLLCLGVLLIGLTLHVNAYDIYVIGQKLAPLPTQPVVFTSVAPVSQNGTLVGAQASPDSAGIFHVTQPAVLLKGTCPKDTYIKFYRNDIFAGTTLCIGDQTFSITISLGNGINTMVARVFSLTDGEGPVSLQLNILHNEIAHSTSTSAEAQDSNATPFYLTSDFKFHGVYVNQPFSWDISIHNGSPPYTLAVDWGDKTTSILNPKAPGTFTLTHSYRSAGGYNGNYVIKIHATDSKGASTFLQLMAVVNAKQPIAVTCTTVMDNSPCSPALLTSSSSISKKLLRVAWPAYGIVILMTASFWLGERQEVFQVFQNKRHVRHRT